jgi:hypothetical protein
MGSDYRIELLKHNTHYAVCEMMAANLPSTAVQAHGMRYLMNLSCDPEQRDVQHKLYRAGCCEQVVAGMRAHVAIAHVQESGLRAIRNMTLSRWGERRREAMLSAQAVDAVIECLQIHTDSDGMKRHGLEALTSLCISNPTMRRGTHENRGRMIAAKLQVVPQLKAHAMMFVDL